MINKNVSLNKMNQDKDKNNDLYSILVVDDDESILQLLEARLSAAGYQVTTACNGTQALEMMELLPFDLVLTDVKMPGLDGQELLAEIKRTWPGIPVMLLTAYGNIPDAVKAIQLGAADYLTKPFDGQELVSGIKDLLARTYPTVNAELVEECGIVCGKSSSMSTLLRMMHRIAGSDVSILIQGESGTGKELVANAIHKWSSRSKGPFVVIDCGSTQTTLIESELFGHVKGAFTHAVQDKKGLIETAHKGTLFFDEIGNISMEMQTRLLRFLQERTLRRVGDTRSIEVDCRILAATNANLSEMVRSGAFREDLFYRLKVVRLEVPALRQRIEDLPLLTDYFLNILKSRHEIGNLELTPAALEKMHEHAWPGNVRELFNVLEAGALLSPDGLIKPEDLQLEHAFAEIEQADESFSLDENEKKAVIRALEKTGWVQKRAAEILGISRRAIHYKIRKHNIAIPSRCSSK